MSNFPILPHERYEALCRRCGMSCHTPILLGSTNVIIPEIHCIHLRYDAEGKAGCAVYDHRHEVAPWCKTAEEAIPLNALAWDCPYAQGRPGFKGKRWAKDWEHEVIRDTLREVLQVKGLPVEDSPESAMKLFKGKWRYERSEDGLTFRFFPL